MCEIKDTVRSLRAEVQAELDSGLKELELQPTSDMANDEEKHTSAVRNPGKLSYSTRVRPETYREQQSYKQNKTHDCVKC